MPAATSQVAGVSPRAAEDRQVATRSGTTIGSSHQAPRRPRTSPEPRDDVQPVESTTVSTPYQGRMAKPIQPRTIQATVAARPCGFPALGSTVASRDAVPQSIGITAPAPGRDISNGRAARRSARRPPVVTDRLLRQVLHLGVPLREQALALGRRAVFREVVVDQLDLRRASAPPAGSACSCSTAPGRISPRRRASARRRSAPSRRTSWRCRDSWRP